MKLLTIVFFLCITGLAIAENKDWLPRKNKNGIQVYSRQVEDSKYEEFKGVVEIDASLASSLALLDDAEACADWLHQCEMSKILDTSGPLERHIYQVNNLPFPAASRDMVFKARVVFVEDGNIRINLVATPDFIDETEYIRIKESRGAYLLEKIDEQRTRLTWIQYVDPAGALPAFMVNSMLTDMPFKSLRNFRKVVQREKYRNVKIIQAEDGALSLSR